ncbi:hypothetical protein [Shewanella glacialipiscicola]|uniref:hypothetical protein n=1 Tax=Shewanella glacialipiscicola TaxID=614069 RepID=UPI003D79AD3A
MFKKLSAYLTRVLNTAQNKIERLLIRVISRSDYWSGIGYAARVKFNEPLIAFIHGHITIEQFGAIGRGETTLTDIVRTLIPAEQFGTIKRGEITLTEALSVFYQDEEKLRDFFNLKAEAPNSLYHDQS